MIGYLGFKKAAAVSTICLATLFAIGAQAEVGNVLSPNEPHKPVSQERVADEKNPAVALKIYLGILAAGFLAPALLTMGSESQRMITTPRRKPAGNSNKTPGL